MKNSLFKLFINSANIAFELGCFFSYNSLCSLTRDFISFKLNKLYLVLSYLMIRKIYLNIISLVLDNPFYYVYLYYHTYIVPCLDSNTCN